MIQKFHDQRPDGTEFILFFFLTAAMALSIPGAPLANQQFMGRAHLNPAV